MRPRITPIVLLLLAVCSLAACSETRTENVLIDPVYHPGHNADVEKDVAVAQVNAKSTADP